MKICVKPRIHISLISMHADGYRINGGIGFAINNPVGELTFTASEDFAFNDLRSYPLAHNEREQLSAIIEEVRDFQNLENSISAELAGGILTHYGMGSGTAIKLACLEALFLLNKKTVSHEELIAYSKRGGTSGIGINTYFHGGFVFDLGTSNSKQRLSPSSQVKTPQSPLLLDSIAMPDWKIGLCIPKNIIPKTQEEEVAFFNKTCPIRPEDSYHTLYHCLFGIYAALKTGNRDEFEKGIREIQNCTWKEKERAEYGNALSRIEDELYELGATSVGMSSLGPLLFFTAKDEILYDLANAGKTETYDILVSSCANTGREVHYPIC